MEAKPQQLMNTIGKPSGRLPKNARRAISRVRVASGPPQSGYDIGLAKVRGGYLLFKWGMELNHTVEQVKANPETPYVYIGDVIEYGKVPGGEFRMNFAPVIV